MNKIIVQLEDRSYPIMIGSGLIHNMSGYLQSEAPAERYFCVADLAVEQTHAFACRESLQMPSEVFAFEAKESKKTIDTLEDIWSKMLANNCTRKVPLLAIGGGLVGDVAGFAASTFMRGVPLIQVPTTLLAMVDASVGGKTAINLPLSQASGATFLGKNLAGAFWQPRLVVADVDTLQTLDNRQFHCGIAECVKHALLGHPELFDWIEAHISELIARDTDSLIELVTRCVEIKVRVVEKDEREMGCRALLNLGHTFAHVIEPLQELSLFHGEAVAIGLCAAMSCAEASGYSSIYSVDRVRTLLEEFDLPTRLPIPIPADALIELMRKDKKAVGGEITLVLPIGINAQIVEGIDESIIALAWASVGAAIS